MSDRFARLFYLFEFVSGLNFIGAVLTPFFTDWGHTTLVVAQSLQSWFALCLFLLEVPTGIIADRYGRKYSIFAGCLVTAIGAIVYGSIPNVAIFAFGEFTLALGLTLISGADKALMYEWLNERGRNAEFSSMWVKAKSWHLAGILFGAPIGSIIAQYLGLNWPMLLWAVPATVGAMTILLVEEPKSHLSSETENQIQYFKKAIQSLRDAATHPVLLSWTLNATLVSAAGYFVIWLYQPLMKSLAIPYQFYGFAQAGMVVAEIAIQYSFGHVEKVVQRPRFLFTMFAILTSAGFLAAALRPGILTLVIFLVVSGGFGLTRIEFMTARMNQFIRSEHRATVNSGILMYLRTVEAILNPFVGLLTDTNVVYSLLVVSCLPLLSLLVPLRSEDQQEK